MARTLYLTKANNDGICHCRCEEALISWPPQMDCPWCGCGWLFTCMKCRRAFTFARPIWVEQSLEDLAREEHLAMWKEPADEDTVGEMVEFMSSMLQPVEEDGGEYVYFDGYVLPVALDDAFRFGDEEPLEISGLHRDHLLERVPHLEAMESEGGWDLLLANTEYWTAGADERDAADLDGAEDD